MDKKTELIEYIQKEIPEIMKLEFGCEVECKHLVYKKGILLYINDRDLFIKPFGECKDGEYIDKKLFIKRDDVDVDVNRIDIKSIEIIGRPISLEDVLRVIKILMKKEMEELGMTKLDKAQEDVLNYWKLGQTIDNQTEETISFLHELLIN